MRFSLYSASFARFKLVDKLHCESSPDSGFRAIYGMFGESRQRLVRGADIVASPIEL